MTQTDFGSIKAALHGKLIQKFNLARLTEANREDVRREASQLLTLILGESIPMNQQERERVVQEVLDEVFHTLSLSTSQKIKLLIWIRLSKPPFRKATLFVCTLLGINLKMGGMAGQSISIRGLFNMAGPTSEMTGYRKIKFIIGIRLFRPPFLKPTLWVCRKLGINRKTGRLA
jgi:hypothetical protein